MYPIVPDSIKQHEIINGYNNCNKNNKSCYEFHKIFSYKGIVLSIQKEVNFEANQLPRPEIIISARVIESFQNSSYIGELRQRWEEIKKLQRNLTTTDLFMWFLNYILVLNHQGNLKNQIKRIG